MENRNEHLLGSFTGRVVNTAGIGIEGALITLPNDHPNPNLGEAVSDTDGTFRMEVARFEEVVIHRICHSLRVQAAGYAPTVVDQRHLSLFETAIKDLGEIVMDIGRAYSGRVFNEAGEPMVGIVVTSNVIRFNPGSTSNPICDETEVLTEDNGRFQTSHIGGGIPSIHCSVNGYQNAYYSEAQLAKVGDNGQLPDLILRAECPIHGVVTNEEGEPIPNVIVSESNRESTTEASGKFTLHGLGKSSSFQCRILHPGYAFVSQYVNVVDGSLEVRDQAEFSRIVDSTKDPKAVPDLLKAATHSTPSLEIVLKREATIRGHVFDAETDEPVEISRIVLCSFSRNENGDVVLDGCRATNADQITLGHFSLTYSSPREYHLTVIADGYEDGEAFTPSVSRLVPIEGIVVKLKRKDSISEIPTMTKQTLVGTIQLDGYPVPAARAAIWTPPRETDIVNAHVIRGRTSVGDGYVWDTQMVNNGKFSLNVRYPDEKWYVLVETPERVVALEGPFQFTTGETKSVELVSRQCGSIYGTVVGDFEMNDEPLHAILFSDMGLQYETRVAIDGTFGFTRVLPGKYGLKLGTDAIIDPEIPGHRTELSDTECWEWNQIPSIPWKRALEVEVGEGEVRNGIMVMFQHYFPAWNASRNQVTNRP
jgi:hypothetical protein